MDTHTTEWIRYFLFVIVMSISVCSGTPRPADKQNSDERW